MLVFFGAAHGGRTRGFLARTAARGFNGACVHGAPALLLSYTIVAYQGDTGRYARRTRQGVAPAGGEIYCSLQADR